MFASTEQQEERKAVIEKVQLELLGSGEEGNKGLALMMMRNTGWRGLLRSDS